MNDELLDKLSRGDECGGGANIRGGGRIGRGIDKGAGLLPDTLVLVTPLSSAWADLPNPQSAIRNPKSAIRNPQSP